MPFAIRRSPSRTCLSQNLQVMDAQATHHCMEHGIPIMVFNFQKDGNIRRAVAGEQIGTLVHPA